MEYQYWVDGIAFTVSQPLLSIRALREHLSLGDDEGLYLQHRECAAVDDDRTLTLAPVGTPGTALSASFVSAPRAVATATTVPLAWLSFGLRPGQRVATPRGDAVVLRPGIGGLRSPDGRIVVCDPYLCAGAPAPVGVLHARPPGDATTTRAARRDATAMQYRTTVCTLRFAAPELGERNMGALVHAHEVSARDAVTGVTRWEPALTAAGEPFTYGVDHGVACFIGGETHATIATSERHHRTIARDLSARDHHHGVIDFRGGATLEWFDSGLGDGHYAVWWGLDDAGLRRCLATDFEVFGSTRGPTG